MFSTRGGFFVQSGGDPYWTSVCLLLNYDTPQTAFTDGSTNNFAMTTVGTPRPNLRTPFTSTGASMSYNGSSGILTAATSGNLVNTDFTWECWAYFNSLAGAPCLIASSVVGNQRTLLYFDPTNGIRYAVARGADQVSIQQGSTTGWSTGVWYHVALVRNANVYNIYRNGTSVATGTNAYAQSDLNAGLSVGYSDAAGSFLYLNGFISNARVVNGTAVYTAAFTPPTSPLTAITNTRLLLNFTNQGQQITAGGGQPIDQGPNSFTITGTQSNSISRSPFFTVAPNLYPGSINLVSSSSQSLTVATNAAFTYGTGDFTIECWFYLNSVGAIQYLIDQRNNGVATAIIPTLYIDASNFLVYYVNGAVRIQGATTLAVSTWYSVSVSRTSTSTKMFLNGTQQGSTYSDSNNYAASRVVVGTHAGAAANYFNGYISNIRLSKGFAYYTTTYTPSTIPLTSDATYTSLLISGNASSLYDLSNSFNALYTGQRTQTSIYKFGTQAGYSVASVTIVDDTVAVQFGTGDFTIEGWFYRIGSGLIVGVIAKGTAITGWRIRINVSNQLVYATAAADVKTSTTTITASTWTYFAWTRSGSTNYMFINGTQEGATFTNSTNLTTGQLQIGGDNVNTNFTGYMDDVRLTKGVARYTATFTAPTSAFPTS